MAGRKVYALLMIFCSLTVWMPVHCQTGLCLQMEKCMNDFREKAKVIGHERDRYCELHRQEMQCLHNVVNTCPTELQDFARKQIASRQKEQEVACDASFMTSSALIVAVGAMLAFVHRRFP